MRNIFILLFALIFISCNNNQEKNRNTTEVIAEKSYHIDYPENWRMDNSRAKTLGTSFILIRNNDDIEQSFNENINLIKEDLNNNVKTLDGYVTNNLEQIKELKDVQILNSEDTQLNNRPAHVLEYIANLTGERLHYIQYYMIEDNHALILTYTGQVKNNYDHQQEVLDILNSFQY